MNYKSTLLTGIVCFALVFLATQQSEAQDRANNKPRVSPNATVSQTIGTTEVLITYGRPSVNERELYGGLVPYNEIWRTGANEATTITFSNDVMVEGEPIEQGVYSLFTIPGKEEWTLIFNNVANQWGAFDYDNTEDALRVTVSPEKAPHVEQLMFYFENVSEDQGTAVMHWGDVKVPFTIEPGS